MRRDLLAHLTRLDPEFFRKGRTGDLMTRMSSDLTIVPDAIGQGLLQGLRTGGALLFASLVVLHAAGTAKPASKPNVIIVMTDDQGYGDVLMTFCHA